MRTAARAASARVLSSSSRATRSWRSASNCGDRGWLREFGGIGSGLFAHEHVESVQLRFQFDAQGWDRVCDAKAVVSAPKVGNENSPITGKSYKLRLRIEQICRYRHSRGREKQIDQATQNASVSADGIPNAAIAWC